MHPFEEGRAGRGSKVFLAVNKHPVWRQRSSPKGRKSRLVFRSARGRKQVRMTPPIHERRMHSYFRLAPPPANPSIQRAEALGRKTGTRQLQPTPARRPAVASPCRRSAHLVRGPGGRGRDRTRQHSPIKGRPYRTPCLFSRRTTVPPHPLNSGASAATTLHGRRRDGVHHHEGVAVGLRGASSASVSNRIVD